MRFLVVSALLLTFSLTAHAQSSFFQGTDLTPLLKVWQKNYIHVTNKPFSLYSWASGSSLGDGAVAVTRVQQNINNFWSQRFGQPTGGSNIFGSGFYAAIDPVATVEYGAWGDRWTLAEVRIRPGTVLAEVDRTVGEDLVYDRDVTKILERFHCDRNLQPLWFFTSGSAMDPQCLQLGRYLFQEYFNVTAITYSYIAMDYYSCTKIQEGLRPAFFFLDGRGFTPANVEYYNEKSTKNPDVRRRIQTLLYEAANIVTRPGDAITTKEAAPTRVSKKILWADLEGQPKSESTTEWLRTEKFGCDGRPPYAY